VRILNLIRVLTFSDVLVAFFTYVDVNFSFYITLHYKKSEMAVFEKSAVHGRNLQIVYSHLLSILPTSVEAECAFS